MLPQQKWYDLEKTRTAAYNVYYSLKSVLILYYG